MKRGFGTNAPASSRQIAWRRSARFKAMGRAACLRFNALQRSKPKCGATKRSDGQPCQNPGLANGRCRLHGGATPAGKQWHRVQYPKGDTPAKRAKFERKLSVRDRLDRKLAKRLATMTADERTRYDAWHRTHMPGPASQRSARRSQAEQDAATRALLASGDRPLPPDRQADLDRIRAMLARIDLIVAERLTPPAAAPVGDLFA